MQDQVTTVRRDGKTSSAIPGVPALDEHAGTRGQVIGRALATAALAANLKKRLSSRGE